MKVTKLKFTKNGRRVSIFIDGEFKLSVEKNVIADFSIFDDKSVDKEFIERIKEEDLIRRYLKKAEFLISKRPRSTFEIEQYIKSKLYKDKSFNNDDRDKVIKKVISRLEKKEYLNDLEFAKWWIDNRVKFKPRGKYLITSELRIKGVESDIIKKALSVNNFDTIKEFELALRLGKKRVRLKGSLKDYNDIRKFVNYLARKGFSYDLAKMVVKKLSKLV